MMQNLCFLSEKYDVDCIILDKDDPSEESLKELKKYAKNIAYVKMGSLFFRAFHCLFNFLTGKPLQNGYFYSHKMKKMIRQNYKNYDAIFCMHMRTGQYVLDLNDIKKYIDCPDCITLNSKNEYKSSKGLRKLLFRIDYMNVKKFESFKYRLFDGIYVINKRDKDFLVGLDKRLEGKTYILYNYVRDLGYKSEYDKISECSICFLGRVAYGPNTAAIKHFVTNIFPYLKGTYPSLIFNVYGGSVTKEIKQLESVEGVRIHGFVDDVAKEIQSNTFVVAPMVSGSGTQNKILECMMLKKLVITTKIGIDGLDDITEDEIVVCNDDKEYIEKCLFYLSSDNYRAMKAIGENSHKYVTSHYSKENSKSQLLDKISL